MLRPIMGCVESQITTPRNDMPPIDAKIVDGSVVINILPLKASSTFGIMLLLFPYNT